MGICFERSKFLDAINNYYCSYSLWMEGKMMEGWLINIAEKMEENEDSWDNLVMFNATKTSFTLWTDNFIYFLTDYDGSDVIETTPRNPVKGYVNPII